MPCGSDMLSTIASNAQVAMMRSKLPLTAGPTLRDQNTRGNSQRKQKIFTPNAWSVLGSPKVQLRDFVTLQTSILFRYQFSVASKFVNTARRRMCGKALPCRSRLNRSWGYAPSPNFVNIYGPKANEGQSPISFVTERRGIASPHIRRQSR